MSFSAGPCQAPAPSGLLSPHTQMLLSSARLSRPHTQRGLSPPPTAPRGPLSRCSKSSLAGWTVSLGFPDPAAWAPASRTGPAHGGRVGRLSSDCLAAGLHAALTRVRGCCFQGCSHFRICSHALLFQTLRLWLPLSGPTQVTFSVSQLNLGPLYPLLSSAAPRVAGRQWPSARRKRNRLALTTVPHRADICGGFSACQDGSECFTNGPFNPDKGPMK